MCKLTTLLKTHPYAKTKFIRSGDEIHLTGCMGLILSGVVAVSESTSDYIIRLVTNGGFIGIIPSSSIYQALDDCRVVFVPLQYVQNVDAVLFKIVAEDNQELTQALLNQVSQPLIDRVRTAIDVLVSLGFICVTNGKPEILKGQMKLGNTTLLARLTVSAQRNHLRHLLF